MTPEAAAPAVFFRLLRAEEKAGALLAALQNVGAGATDPSVHFVGPASFSAVPGAAFAYWVSNAVRQLFRRLPALQGTIGEARQGLATADDFRFVRARWEVPEVRIARSRQETLPAPAGPGKLWVAFAKGGEFSPYWSDIHLVVNWWNDGEELRKFTRAFIRSDAYYFLPGLTWPLRTQGGLSFRALPGGCAFGHKGPAVFPSTVADAPLVLAITNTRAFRLLVELQMAFGSYEVGVIQRTPWPAISEMLGTRITALGLRCHDLIRELATADETTLAFVAPTLARPGNDLRGRYLGALAEAEALRVQVIEGANEADRLALDLYEIGSEDRARVDAEMGEHPGSLPKDPLILDDELLTKSYVRREEPRGEAPDESENEDEGEQPRRGRGSFPSLDRIALSLKVHPSIVAERRKALELFRDEELAEAIQDLLMYCVGCAFGRWDVRIGVERSRAPALPAAFEPLPLVAPGRFARRDGLPAEAGDMPADYPVRSVAWSGVLADADIGLSSGRSGDLVSVVHEVLTVLFGESADAIETEAARSLGVRDLRAYLRSKFFAFHLGRYSKSRRKAPIYWPLQSDHRSLTIWLYAPRIKRETLYVAITDFIEPKILIAESRLRELQKQREAELPRRERMKLDKEVDRQQEVLAELARFKSSVETVIALGYAPDPDDGIIVNAAPLRELLPLWPDAKRMWQELIGGKYAWSALSARLRAKGLVRGEARG